METKLNYQELVALYRRAQNDEDLTKEEWNQIDKLRCSFTLECPVLEDCDYRCVSRMSNMIDCLKD